MSFTSTSLYARLVRTLIASWAFLAEGSPGARVIALAGARAAVFPCAPASAVFNNALIECSASDADTTRLAVERAYAAAGISSFAAWVHEREQQACAAFIRSGYAVSETTLCMAASLDQLSTPIEPDARVTVGDPAEAIAVNGLPAGILDGLGERGRFFILREREAPVCAALAFHHGGDCGVFFVATVPHARRRGYARAVMRHLLSDARAAGCRTTSLHATEMSKGLYASMGYLDLGRFLEFEPADRRRVVSRGSSMAC